MTMLMMNDMTTRVVITMDVVFDILLMTLLMVMLFLIVVSHG